ncbi:colicin D domain-containing protein [Leifsonia xyli]|uniref:colicin D domain-containing protein n=1 Tax=Leifsonia xyli TaxID=1575 RepID=UPI0009D64229
MEQATATEYRSAINQHLNEAGVAEIRGTYRGDIPTTHYFEESTGLNLMLGQRGQYMSGWLLSETQSMNLLRIGNVQ